MNLTREEMDFITKICSLCSLEKPITEFHFRKDSLDGYYSSCKECRRAYNRERYERKRTLVLEQKKTYWQNNKERITERRKNPESIRKQNQRYRIRRATDVEIHKKLKANRETNKAVRKGLLPNPKTCLCAKCGNPAVEYHHHSYEIEYWLDVIPVCHTCHMNIHPGRKTPTVPEDHNWRRKRQHLSPRQLEVLKRNQKPYRKQKNKHDQAN